ncbi:hypothetical protein G9A89_005067 [Geosiphon pyriformis]|nr:hypothetical protein G9A89_005067 [Geosiphon pyriformis]
MNLSSKSNNCVEALLNREINCLRPNTNISKNRNFYSSIYPNESILDVKIPNSAIFRRFTPDGQHMICFSSCLRVIQVYNFEAICLESPLDVNSYTFEKFFWLKYENSITENYAELLCKDFCLITKNNKYMILASSAQSVCSPDEARKYPCSLNSLSTFDDITFYIVHIETGQICDKIKYKSECIYLQHHSGVGLIGNLFAILSVQNQTIHILHIKDDGHFVNVRSIGWFNHDDDGLVLAQYREFDAQYEAQCRTHGNPKKRRKFSHDNYIYEDILKNTTHLFSQEDINVNVPMEYEVPSASSLNSTSQPSINHVSDIIQPPSTEEGSPPFSGIKQKLLSYLFKKAFNKDDGGSALRHFYQIFGQLISLVMWRMQFIDESRLLIKFTSLDCVIGRHSENAIHPAFFVMYNHQNADIESVYDNASEEFLEEFERSSEIYRQTAFNEPFFFNSTYSNNPYARENLKKHQYAVRYARNGGPTQAIKRVLACLPFCPQSRSESPYFDQSLFSYDEKIISASDRPKPSHDGPAKFYSRATGEFKFQIQLTPSTRGANRVKRYVSFISHPWFPFIISVQYTLLQPTIVNFHVRAPQ